MSTITEGEGHENSGLWVNDLHLLINVKGVVALEITIFQAS